MQVFKTIKRDASSYKNDNVINYYCQKYGVERQKAEEVFKALISFLSESANRNVHLVPPNKAVDNLWHIFILHTYDYYNFCNDYFGKIVHHYPNGFNKNCGASDAPAPPVERK